MKVLLLYAIVPILLLGRDNDPCSDAELGVSWTSSPILVEADELADELKGVGIQVQCMRRSKQENLFGSEAGAAWVKSDQGVFEILFLPDVDSFSALQVIERSAADGRFTYSFAGTPQIKTIFDSSERMWFVKHRNVLVEIWGDSKLAARIGKAFGK